MQNYYFDYYQYKKKINSHKTAGFSLIFFFIIILTGIAMLVYPKSKTYTVVYFVEINSFLNYKDASTLANEISALGGAGYVYYDGKYHVLASYYPSEEDANTVSENLLTDYPTAKVYTIEIDKVSLSNELSSSQQDCIKDQINANEKLINSLYNTIIQYDSNNISDSEINMILSNIKTDFSDCKDHFFELFKNDSRLNIAKKYLSKISQYVEQFGEMKDEQNISSRLKYYLIDIVINHSSFLSAF